MNKIEITLREKLKELSILPGLLELTLEKGFCAGGAVRDIARGAKPRDYDIFFKSADAVEEFKQKYSHLCEETVLGNFNLADFQFITIYFGSPKDIISQFDWNVNQKYCDFAITNNPSYEYTETHLSFNCNASYRLSALLRLPKFIEMGYKIEPRELAFVVCYIAATGVLASSEAVEAELSFVPSSGHAINLKGIPERATKAAIQSSPLMKALREK